MSQIAFVRATPVRGRPRIYIAYPQLSPGTSNLLFQDNELRRIDFGMTFEDPQALILAGVAVLAALYVVRWKTHPVSHEGKAYRRDGVTDHDLLNTQLNPIPTVGGSGAPGLSILTALNFSRNGKELLEEGYQKVRSCPSFPHTM